MKKLFLLCACILFGAGVAAAQIPDSTVMPVTVTATSVQTSIDSLGNTLNERFAAQQRQLDNMDEQARGNNRYNWEAIPGNQLARVINSLIPAIVFAAIVLAIYLFMNFWYHNKLAKYRVQMNLDPGQGMPDTALPLPLFKRNSKEMKTFGDPVGRLYRNMMTACYTLFVVFLLVSLGGNVASEYYEYTRWAFCSVMTVFFLIAGIIFMTKYIKHCESEKQRETAHSNDDNRQ